MTRISQYDAEGAFVTSTDISDERIALATAQDLIRRGESVRVTTV